MLLLTTIGAKSGEPRTTPLVYSIEDGKLVIIASMNGAPTHPAWYHNLIAQPVVTIETGGETFQAHATVVADETERHHIYDQHAELHASFTEYEARAGGRVIPVVLLDAVDPRLQRLMRAPLGRIDTPACLPVTRPGPDGPLRSADGPVGPPGRYARSATIGDEASPSVAIRVPSAAARAAQTLDRLHAGQAALVLSVDGPAAAELLHEGIAPGVSVAVASRTPLGGPLIVLVGRARVAVARPAAAGVRVVSPGSDGA